MLVPVKNDAKKKGVLMKIFEELARIHANEAIQRALEAQRIHRSLSERREKRSHQKDFTVMQGPARRYNKFSQLTTLFNQIHRNAVLTLTKGLMFRSKNID